MSIEKEAQLTSKLLRAMADDETLLDKEAQLKRNAEIGLIVEYLEKDAAAAERVIGQVFADAPVKKTAAPINEAVAALEAEDVKPAPAANEPGAPEPTPEPPPKPVMKTPPKKRVRKAAPATPPPAPIPAVEEAKAASVSKDKTPEKKADDETAATEPSEDSAKPSASVGIFQGVSSRLKKTRFSMENSAE